MKYGCLDMLKSIAITSILFSFSFFFTPCSYVWSLDQLWPMKCELHIHLSLHVFSSFLCFYPVWCSVHCTSWICGLMSFRKFLAIIFANTASVWYSSYRHIKPFSVSLMFIYCSFCFSLCASVWVFNWPALEFHNHVFALFKLMLKFI